MSLNEQIIQEYEASREQILSLIAGLEPDKEVYPGWTVKDLLAHFTGWDDLVISVIKGQLANNPPSPSVLRGLDFFNAATVSERAELPFEVVFAEWNGTRNSLKELLRTLPEDRLTETIPFPWGEPGILIDFLHIFSAHEVEHAKEIREKMTL